MRCSGSTQFPVPQAKTQASEFVIISGGCAANAAVAIARLGGRARFAGPLGGPAGAGADRRPHRGGARGRAGGHRRLRAGAGRRVLDVGDLRRSRKASAPSSTTATTGSPPPGRPIPPPWWRPPPRCWRTTAFRSSCCRSARPRGRAASRSCSTPTSRRGRPTSCSRVASHVVFSAEGLRATAGTHDLGAGLARMAAATRSFLAVTDGANGMLWLVPGEPGSAARCPPSRSSRSIRWRPATSFTARSRWRSREGRAESAAMRFAAAAAAIKCTRFGGITGAPARARGRGLPGGPHRRPERGLK